MFGSNFAKVEILEVKTAKGPLRVCVVVFVCTHIKFNKQFVL